MNNIPNEILILILTKLSVKDTLACTEVCKRWRFVLTEGIGLFKKFGSESQPILQVDQLMKTKFQNIEEIQKYGLESCVLSNIGDLNVPNFRKPFLLKSLAFYYPISRDNFNKLVTPLENLRVLWLHITALNHFKMEEGSIWLNFPKLQILSILCEGMSPDSYNQFSNRDLLLANVSTIMLDGKFPKLEELNVDVPGETSLLNPFSTFLTNHQNTLRRFKVEIIDRLNITEITDDEEEPEIEIPVLQIQGLRLSSIYLDGNRVNKNMGTFFNSIIQSQNSLRHYVNTASFNYFKPDLVLQNAKTLVVLEILIKGGIFQQLDFKVFEECTSLKSLFLIGNKNEGHTPTIVNTKYLPNLLQGVRIVNIKINSNDASDLATKEWDDLFVLELQHIGVFDNFGVPLPALCQLFALKRIKNVYLWEAINYESARHYYGYDGERDIVPPEAIELGSRLSDLSVDNLSGRFSLNDDQKYVFSDRDLGGTFQVEHYRVRMCIESAKFEPDPDEEHTHYLSLSVNVLQFF